MDILAALQKLKNGKSPGTSGFQADFFKFFWNDIGPFVARSFNFSNQKLELSSSQKLGIIIILPKGNKPRDFLKNWRPISLLNSTYKRSTVLYLVILPEIWPPVDFVWATVYLQF